MGRKSLPACRPWSNESVSKLLNQLDTNLSFVFCCGKVMHAKLLKESKIPGNMRVLTVYLCCQEKSGQGC